jgi:hypothetical protein
VFVDSSTLSAAKSLFALSNDNTFPMKYEREEPEIYVEFLTLKL